MARLWERGIVAQGHCGSARGTRRRPRCPCLWGPGPRPGGSTASAASSRTVRLCGRQQPPRRHRPPPQRNYFGARARRVASAEVRRSTAQSRRWLTTAPGGPPATDSRLPAAGQYARAVDSSRQRTRIWGRRAPQQHGCFECDERMGAAVIGPVASLAHYCSSTAVSSVTSAWARQSSAQSRH